MSGVDERHGQTCGCACGHSHANEYSLEKALSHEHTHKGEACAEHCHAHGEGHCACHGQTPADSRKELWVIAAAAALLAGGLLTDGWVRLGLLLLAYLAAGGEVLFHAATGLFKGRLADENVLMSVATIGAMILGDYAEGVMVMLLYRIGEFLQGLAVRRSRASISATLNLRPDKVRILRESGEGSPFVEELLPVEKAKLGDRFLVLPGERVPLDGVVIEGNGFVDCSAITGESVPVHVKEGAALLSGSVNQTGRLLARADKTAGESTASRILRAVEEAVETKPRMEGFITRFARVYTPVVMLLTLLVAVIPPLFGLGEWKEWIHRGLLLLVISCPCALVLSVPLTFFAGLARESSAGVLLKGANVMETLVRAKTVAFDKTGTVTRGGFSVTMVEAENGFNKEELIELAAAVERGSTHPIAHAVAAAAKQTLPCSDMEELAGHGVAGVVNGRRVLAGNARLMEREGVAHPGEAQAKTEVLVAVDGLYAGRVLIEDELRPGSAEAIRRLKDRALHTAMLTGDAQGTASAVAQAVGVGEVHAALLPGDKLHVLQTIRQKHGPTVFVGDGINDAPVLAGADVGCAMGIGGSDAAVEAADMVLMGEELGALPEAIGIAGRTLSIAKANVIFALGVKLAVMILGVLGYAEMWMAVFADVGTALLCVLNALRLLPRKKRAAGY